MDCGIMHKFSDLKTLKNRRKRNQRFYFRNLKNKQARKFKETTPEILYETSIQIPQRSRSRKLIFNRIWDESKQDYIIKGNKANVNEGYPTQLPRATNKITPRIATLINVALRKLEQTIGNSPILLLHAHKRHNYNKLQFNKLNSPFLNLRVTGSDESRKHFKTATIERFA